MASGKSTVGPCLAEKLGWSFVDLDAEIVLEQGRPIADIFHEQGEAHFRQIEHDVLKQVLSTMSRQTVVALGGGTFIQARNREMLRQHEAKTVYLSGEFSMSLERCQAQRGSRPLAMD